MAARTKAVPLAIALVAQLMLVPTARAADQPIVWFPVGPGAEGSIFTRATTTDPFELRTSGPIAIQFARMSVDPGGSTGLTPRRGVTVTTVVEGVATVLSGEADTCARRTVNAGFALIETEGSGTEIRNDGHTPLDLYAATFTAAGPPPAAGPPSAGPCPVTASKHATVAILNRAIVEGPLSAESKGLQDVYMGAARFVGNGRIGWHVQHRPLFGGVDQGKLTVDLASSDGCQRGVFPAGAGFHEPAQTVHAVTNESGAPASFYYVAFAATPQPFLAPSPPPGQCERS